jgi:hypothetical protein
MKLYTCCPNDTCEAFQRAIDWLYSKGIEPSVECDGEHHFFEFGFPKEWSIERRIDFNWELAHLTAGMVFCRCDRWLDEDAIGQCYKFTCHSCGREYKLCQECNALNEWAGCPCVSHDEE